VLGERGEWKKKTRRPPSFKKKKARTYLFVRKKKGRTRERTEDCRKWKRDSTTTP